MSGARDHGANGLAVMLGSGMGSVCAGWPVLQEVPFDSVPGMGSERVPGHEGVLRSCDVFGRPVLFIVGRKHGYEGSVRPVRALIDHIADLGVTRILLTSASGSLARTFQPGEIGLVEDLIDLQFRLPAGRDESRNAAPDDPVNGGGRDLAPGFPRDRIACGRRSGLDPAFVTRVLAAAVAAGVPLRGGVLACMTGPAYESPAEVAMLQAAGAHFVTMSAAPEIEFAARQGIAVAALAVITNYATGISRTRLAHNEVLETGAAAAGRLRGIIEQLIAMK